MIYEGPIRVSTTDKDGNPRLVKNGPNAGKPWCMVSFQTDGEWVNLADFKNSAAGVTSAKVAYSAKVDAFGEPELYNGKPQYNLDALKPMESAPAAEQAQNGSTTTEHKEPYNPGLGAFQTALNNAVNVEVALIGAKVVKEFSMDSVLDRADAFHIYLVTGKSDPLERALDSANTLQEAVSQATDKFDATPVSEDLDNLPF